MKFKTLYFLLAGLLAVGPVAADTKTDAEFNQMMQSSFRDEGIATVDRLKQDETNAACSKAMGAHLPKRAWHDLE